MSAVLDLEVKKAYTKSESFHLVCHVNFHQAPNNSLLHAFNDFS